MRIRDLLRCIAIAFAAFSAPLATAQAAPTVRYQVDQNGDFVLIGNTVGHDCGNGTPAPTVGTLPMNCGSSISDSAPDIFWSADTPGAGQATADTSITVAQARSTAVLGVPQGATVTYAHTKCGGSDAAARFAAIPNAEPPVIPTLPFDHGCAAHHSTVS